MNVLTDAEGSFQTGLVPRHIEPPPPIAPGRFPIRGGPGIDLRAREAYTATITAPRYLRQQVAVTVGPSGNPFIVPDIVLEREGGTAGRVVDRQGKPIEGVALRADGAINQRTAQATSGADGRFTLRSLHPDARFVFATHADYLLAGGPIPADEGDVKIVLSRRAEAAADPRLTPDARTKDERSAALSRVFTLLWNKLDGKEPANDLLRSEVLTYLAPHDPQFAEAKLPEISNARRKFEILKLLGKTDDALAALADFRPEQPKVDALIELATSDPARGHELLGEAAVQARRLVVPEQRLQVAMRIAAALIKLGNRGEAQSIIDANLPEI